MLSSPPLISCGRRENQLSVAGERSPYIQNSVAQGFGEVVPRLPLPGGHKRFPERLYSRIGYVTLPTDSALSFSSSRMKEEEIFRRLRLEGSRCASGKLYNVIFNETVRELELFLFLSPQTRPKWTYRFHSYKAFL
jgi:hypothetical protein